MTDVKNRSTAEHKAGSDTGGLQFFAANDTRQGFNTIIPMNRANFPVSPNQGSYLFNLANPAVQQLGRGLNVWEAVNSHE